MSAIRRKLGLGGTALGLVGMAAGFVVVLPADEAEAHGGLTYPATRTYACYADGQAGGNGGDLDPNNPMCAAAWDEDIYPFWNWFGNLLPHPDGRHQEVIPDGELCGPGDGFSAFNAAPAEEWPTTQLQSGADIEFQYNAWAPHPGTWYQYITTDDWDPDTPLSWDDLEPAPFDEVTDPPIRSGGVQGPEYHWDATLPEKQGQHIIYSIWQRSDSPEAFYNCSDVYFGDEPVEAGDSGDAGDLDGVEIDTVAARDGVATQDHDHAPHDHGAHDHAGQEAAASGSLSAGHVGLSAGGGLLLGIWLTLLARRRQTGGVHRA